MATVTVPQDGDVVDIEGYGQVRVESHDDYIYLREVRPADSRGFGQSISIVTNGGTAKLLKEQIDSDNMSEWRLKALAEKYKAGVRVSWSSFDGNAGRGQRMIHFYAYAVALAVLLDESREDIDVDVHITRIKEQEAERAAARERAEAEANAKQGERRELLLNEFLESEVKVRVRGYRSVVKAVVKVRQIGTDNWVPEVRYVNSNDYNRPRDIRSIERLEVKDGSRYKVLWDDRQTVGGEQRDHVQPYA